MIWRFLKAVGRALAGCSAACFPMMDCRKCGARVAKVDDGLCATCWWDKGIDE